MRSSVRSILVCLEQRRTKVNKLEVEEMPMGCWECCLAVDAVVLGGHIELLECFRGVKQFGTIKSGMVQKVFVQ